VIRLLSVSEATTLLDCPWRWDLAYGGHLAGAALKSRTTPVLLREGRAWGRGMAELHSNWNRTDRVTRAQAAVIEALAEDASHQSEAGTYDPGEHEQVSDLVLGALAHYDTLDEPLPLYGAETYLLQALPARERHSNRYRLECYLDGLHDDPHGTWLVEFKWRRSRLKDFELAARDRQLRWYAWAWREHLGREPVGVILDERLGVLPAAVRLNANGQVSKVQSCTPEDYEAAGGSDRDVLAQLKGKVWQARRRITFRPGELDQAGAELRSLARLVQQYDSGQLAPVRVPHERNCNGCRYRAVCDDPWDTELVDALYERQPAKRDRELVTGAA
jgi:hypothetical protein